MNDVLLQSGPSGDFRRTASFHDPEGSSDEEWADALEQPGAEQPVASTSRSDGPDSDESLTARTRDNDVKSAEDFSGPPRQRPPLSNTADFRDSRPGVQLKAPQLLHKRSDSAFSTAESSGIAAGPATGSIEAVPDRGQRLASIADEYPAHRAAFEGDDNMAIDALFGLSQEQKFRQDPHGNTVLHLAVIRQRHALIDRLLAMGFRSSTRNARGWTAIDEAAAIMDRHSVRVLHTAEVAAVKADIQSKRGLLLQTMRDMPQYTFKLKWELGSPVFGPMLRRFAPNDTYQVWKMGSMMRVDGTLMGIEDKNPGLIPEWKRGSFSLLFDGAPKPATLIFLDHKKKRYFNLTAERKKQGSTTEAEVSDIMMSSRGRKTKMKASEFRFKPVRGWLGGEQTETIEGWKTKVYEASGKMNAVTTTKGKLDIPQGATFEDYLALTLEDDSTEVQPVDIFSMGSGSKGSEAPEEEAAGRGKKAGSAKVPRKLSAKCWMAAGFPMSLHQLLPILDIVGHTNKHLARVGKFMHKYGDMELFPVKLQVPLLWTAYAQVSFRDFKGLDLRSLAGQSDWYQVPAGYTARTLDEAAAHRQQKHQQDGLLEANFRASAEDTDGATAVDEREQLRQLLKNEEQKSL